MIFSFALRSHLLSLCGAYLAQKISRIIVRGRNVGDRRFAVAAAVWAPIRETKNVCRRDAQENLVERRHTLFFLWCVKNDEIIGVNRRTCSVILEAIVRLHLIALTTSLTTYIDGVRERERSREVENLREFPARGWKTLNTFRTVALMAERESERARANEEKKMLCWKMKISRLLSSRSALDFSLRTHNQHAVERSNTQDQMTSKTKKKNFEYRKFLSLVITQNSLSYVSFHSVCSCVHRLTDASVTLFVNESRTEFDREIIFAVREWEVYIFL